MKLIGFEFNYQNGDLQYLFRRDKPNRDGHLDHAGTITAGDTGALATGVLAQDSFDREIPAYAIVPFPEDFVQVVKALWARPEIKDVVAWRRGESMRLAEEEEQKREVARLTQERQEAAAKSAFEDAVLQAVTAMRAVQV